MSPSEQPLPIGRPGPTCTRCGAPLERVPKHHSRLVPGKGEETSDREDFCPQCQAEARAGEYHSLWLAQRPAPPPPPRRETRKAQSVRLREAFYRLVDVPDPGDEERDSLFLLAHLLMKLGGFRWRETDEEAGVIIFEDQATKGRCEVPLVALDGERLAQAQERLNSLL